MTMPEEPEHGPAIMTGWKLENGVLMLFQGDEDQNYWDIEWNQDTYEELLAAATTPPDFGDAPPPVDAPTAVATGTPLSGSHPLTVAFDSSGSSDAGTGIITMTMWNFGDGSAGDATAAPSHTYSAAGAYTVTLMVVDDEANTDLDTLAVVVT